MKKYIALATLLAAGTAFAGAEVVNLDLPGSVLCSPTGNLGSTSDGLAVLNARLNADYGVYAGNAGGQVTWNQTNTSGLEGYWTQESQTSGYITLAGRSGAGGENFALVLGQKIEIGTSIESITFSYDISSPESNALKLDGLVFGFALGYIPSAEGEEAVKTENIQLTYGTNSTSGTVTLTFGETITWSEGDKIIFAMGGAKGGNPKPTALYNVEVSGVISTIPEPSAFGLLAGLGALALVASRRRRK